MDHLVKTEWIEHADDDSAPDGFLTETAIRNSNGIVLPSEACKEDDSTNLMTQTTFCAEARKDLLSGMPHQTGSQTLKSHFIKSEELTAHEDGDISRVVSEVDTAVKQSEFVKLQSASEGGLNELSIRGESSEISSKQGSSPCKAEWSSGDTLPSAKLKSENVDQQKSVIAPAQLEVLKSEDTHLGNPTSTESDKQDTSKTGQVSETLPNPRDTGEAKRKMTQAQRRAKLRALDPWNGEQMTSNNLTQITSTEAGWQQHLSILPRLHPICHLYNYEVQMTPEKVARVQLIMEEMEEITKAAADAAADELASSVTKIANNSTFPPHKIFTLLDQISTKLKRRPMILIPSEDIIVGSTIGWQQSVLHFGNAWEFFEKGRLVLPGCPKLPEDERPIVQQGRQIVCQKFAFRSHPVKVALVDSSKVCRFDAVDWQSVVCVLLSGQEWQLKDWPFSPPESIGEKVRCVFFTFKDAPLPKVVASHPQCQVFYFPRMLRHADGELQRSFWAHVAEHIAKPWVETNGV